MLGSASGETCTDNGAELEAYVSQTGFYGLFAVFFGTWRGRDSRGK